MHALRIRASVAKCSGKVLGESYLLERVDPVVPYRLGWSLRANVHPP